MNERSLARNMGRIPALIGHIKRCTAKKQPKRVKGFQQELDRRTLEMAAAGKKKECDKLIKDAKAALSKAA